MSFPKSSRGPAAVVQGLLGRSSDARLPQSLFETFTPPRREGLHAKGGLGTLEVVPIEIGQVNDLLDRERLTVALDELAEVQPKSVASARKLVAQRTILEEAIALPPHLTKPRVYLTSAFVANGVLA